MACACESKTKSKTMRRTDEERTKENESGKDVPAEDGAVTSSLVRVRARARSEGGRTRGRGMWTPRPQM